MELVIGTQTGYIHERVTSVTQYNRIHVTAMNSFVRQHEDFFLWIALGK